MEKLNEVAIGLALVASIAALVTVVIVAGASSLPATGLKDLAILLGGALAGSKIPR